MRAKHIVLGLLIAVIAVRLFHLATAPGDVQLFTLFLAYTACVYPGAGLSDGQRPWLAIEAAFSALVFLCAWLGLSQSPIWLAAGYGVHGAWDLAHHPRLIRTRIVGWFPPICAVFDFAVAGYVLFRY